MPSVLFAVLLAVLPLSSFAQTEAVTDQYATATVIEILSQERGDAAGFETVTQRLIVETDDGERRTVEFGVVGGREDTLFERGDRIVLERITRVDGSEAYLVREPYRLPSVFLLFGAFFVLAITFAGRTGFTSIVGLAVSIGVLVFFVVPWIGRGSNPLLVSVAGSVVIACTSLYLAHGFHYRTSVALLSTIVTLMLSLLLSMIAVWMTQLLGMGTEETMFLQLGPLQAVNLKGLLLGGIVIGALGVLDDITTTQTAAIHEIKRANPRMSRHDLYRSGLAIGREHIASLVNTLALAYAGASLPLLLLFWSGADAPWWVILNNESLVEEIVRTLAGSMTLTLAVPISTWFACRLLKGAESGRTHVHAH